MYCSESSAWPSPAWRIRRRPGSGPGWTSAPPSSRSALDSRTGCASWRPELQRLGEAADARLVDVLAPRLGRLVAAGFVEGDRLGLQMTGRQPQRRIPFLLGHVLQAREQHPREPTPTRLRYDVHPLHLAVTGMRA